MPQATATKFQTEIVSSKQRCTCSVYRTAFLTSQIELGLLDRTAPKGLGIKIGGGGAPSLIASVIIGLRETAFGRSFRFCLFSFSGSRKPCPDTIWFLQLGKQFCNGLPKLCRIFEKRRGGGQV